MTDTKSSEKIGLASHLVNQILAIKPLADFAKSRARNMMINRAESIGVPWRENCRKLSDHNWEPELQAVTNPYLNYPHYYLTSFHAYESGNMSWQAAWEVESAARAVHAKIWQDAGVEGDAQLRASYHHVLQEHLVQPPQKILDLGCGVGMSSFALQKIYPQAEITGIDLSPYFLAVAQYRSQENFEPNSGKSQIHWLHCAAEDTSLPDNSVDFVSACLVFHELPTTAAQAIIKEAYRVVRPGGYLGIMDMNPNSEVFLKMPPYILTLLKSTEPYLDQYFVLDMEKTFTEVGFNQPTITVNSPRHRTIIATKPETI